MVSTHAGAYNWMFYINVTNCNMIMSESLWNSMPPIISFEPGARSFSF